MTHFLQLHEHVKLVGSGELALSHYLDCHTYLLHDGDDYALIDAGSGVQTERLIENLNAPSAICRCCAICCSPIAMAIMQAEFTS